MSQRLCKSARKAMLKGEDAVMACVCDAGPADRVSAGGHAARILGGQNVILMVTSHRLLVLRSNGGNEVGEPILGVGPHNLLRLDVRMKSPVTGEVHIQFLDGSVATLEMITTRHVPKLKAAFAHLLPEAA